jgi:hypothetical protein
MGKTLPPPHNFSGAEVKQTVSLRRVRRHSVECGPPLATNQFALRPTYPFITAGDGKVTVETRNTSGREQVGQAFVPVLGRILRAQFDEQMCV